MKKALSVFLALCIAVSLLTAASAADVDDAAAERAVRALGIMVGDADGNLNLSNAVTRAEFAKMMVAASPYKDTIGEGTGYSLFKDVKSTHWAAEYIKLAVANGWFTGYLDGTFRPDNQIKLEEAAAAVLRLLEYTPDDLKGSYPTAQLSKFNALGLGAGVKKTRGDTLTRYDCMLIFYNLMTATSKNGSVYAISLGHTLNSAGELDYAALVLSGMKGPFVLTSGNIEALLPFNSVNISVYRNSRTADLSSAAVYDVYYYNAGLRTVWLYSEKATGVLSAVSPGIAAPSSVTVAGISYTLDTSPASYKVSSLGEFAAGDTVTLLLGMNGTVVDIVSASSVSESLYGIVVKTGTRSYTDSNGAAVTVKTARVACTDGVERDYDTTANLAAGYIVSIGYSGGQSGISSIAGRSLSGTVNKDASSLGSLAFADKVGILDADSGGNYVSIDPERIAGAALKNADIRFYALNEYGEISHLILNDVTGDLYDYGLLTSVVEENPGSFTLKGTYSYIIDGTAATWNTSTVLYNVVRGGAFFKYKNGSIDSIKNLTETALSAVSEFSAEGADKKYLLADNVQVYIKNSDNTYDLTNITAVINTGKYKLAGYYDALGFPAGGRIRVIVATPLS